MSLTFHVEITLLKEECISCGVTFAVPSNLRAQRLKDHKSFYCPNGHGQNFTGETEAEKYKRLYDAQQTETIRQRENYFAEQRKHEQTQKAMTRLKKRTAAGICPCCKRTFSQLARHMHTKHEEFVKEHGLPVSEKA